MQTFHARITTDTDTTLLAAKTGRAWRIRRLMIFVEDAGTSGLVRIEDGAGGDVLVAHLTANGPLILEPQDLRDGYRSLEGSAGALLNAETSGSVKVVISGEAEEI